MAKPSWVTLSKSSGTEGGSVNVTCKANTGTSRSGSITVKTASGLTKTVSLSQAANTSSIFCTWNVTIKNNTGSQLTLHSQSIGLFPTNSYSNSINILSSGKSISINPGAGTSLGNTTGIFVDMKASTRVYNYVKHNFGARKVYGSTTHINNRSISIDGIGNTWIQISPITFNAGDTCHITGSIPLVS